MWKISLVFKISSKPIFLAAFMVCLFSAPLLATAEEMDQKAKDLALTIRQLKEDIKELESEISSTDSAKKAEEKRAEAAEQRRAQEIENRREEISKLQEKISETKSETQSLLSQASSIENKAKNISLKEENLRDFLINTLDSMETRIYGSIPWNREDRLDNIRVLRRDLESGVSSPAEGVQRTLSALEKEIEFVDEIEITTKPITRKTGDVVNAQALRLGAQWIVYMDEEEKVWFINGARTWSLTNAMPFEKR